MTAKIIGTGSYLPEKSMSNHQMAEIVDTSDEWIQSRTGIISRHVAGDWETTGWMAAQAAWAALTRSGRKPEDIGLIIVATSSSQTVFPSTACQVQQEIGAVQAICYDLSGACTGFLLALQAGYSYLKAGLCRNALIIGAERMTDLLDFKDRNTCVLFGDGAGAVVLTADKPGILDMECGADGSGGEVLTCPTGGKLTMDGRQVYKFAVNKVTNVIQTLLDRNHMKPEQADYYLLHQANARIIQAVSKRLEVSVDKFPMNMAQCGNTSAASIPVLLDEMVKDGRLQAGEKLLMVGFGAGLTWGGALLEW